MIDLSSPATFQDGVPWDTFTDMRHDGGFHWVIEEDGPGYWAVTRYMDVVALYRDHKHLSSAQGSAQMHNYDEGTLTMLRRMLPNMDLPEHSNLRKVYMSWLGPNMDRIRLGIIPIVDEVMESVRGRESFDFLNDFARYIPVRVIGRIMGVPESDWDLMLRWCDRLASATGALDADGMNAAMEVIGYTKDLADHYRAHPADNLTSVLANAKVDLAFPIYENRHLEDLEVGLQFLAMLVGGNETTRQAMCQWVLGLQGQRRNWNALTLHPTVIPNSAEEALRWGSPVLGGRRTAVANIEGTPIAEGHKVFLYYVSANHDEDIFPDPHIFDPVRYNANKHTSFGAWGPHRCLGAAITQAEMHSTIAALLQAYSFLEVDGFPRRLRSNFFNAVDDLPVVATPR